MDKTVNIILIGMPGCGKSTIGMMLSKGLGLDFIDLDVYIEEKTGKSITELFEQGEDHFRQIESDAIQELSTIQSTIISTGGGVIKKQCNIEKLKDNGIILFIDRPIEDIASDVEIKTRPLLREGTEKLYQLFNERYELYHKYCDILVKNDQNIEIVVANIMMFLEKRSV